MEGRRIFTEEEAAKEVADIQAVWGIEGMEMTEEEALVAKRFFMGQCELEDLKKALKRD